MLTFALAFGDAQNFINVHWPWYVVAVLIDLWYLEPVTLTRSRSR